MNKSRHVNGTNQQVNTSNLVEKGEKLIQLLRKKINRSIIQYADLKKSKKRIYANIASSRHYVY